MTLTESIGRKKALTILVLVGLITTVALGALHSASSSVEGQNKPSMTGSQIFQAVGDSVVMVQGSRSLPDAVLPAGIESRLSVMPQLQSVAGTGLAIDDEGHILTTMDHVRGSEDIHVVRTDGRWFQAELVGYDELSNLAVLAVKSDDHGLRALEHAAAGDAVVGETVFAFGFAGGPAARLTSGILSGIDGEGSMWQDSRVTHSIQSDVEILPGMTGGPLINERGEVIGMNMGAGSTFAQGPSLNSAVPAHIFDEIVPALAAGNAPPYPYLGVQAGVLTINTAKELELGSLFSGSLVAEVGVDSPAAAGGMQAGDLITEIDGTAVSGFRDMASRLLFEFEPGDTVNLSILRDGQAQEIAVELGARSGVTN